MSHGDPLKAFEDALFDAARRERTESGARERTANAVVFSHRRRRFRRSLWTLGGAVALAAGAAFVLRSGSSDESIQAEPIAPKHAVTSVAASPVPAPEPAEAADDSANPAAGGGAALRSGLAPSVVATTLEEETAMLERARAELTSGKPESALSLLDRYDRVSGGHLTAEATLLRIQALSLAGRSSLAAKLAKRLVDSDPNGPVAERARRYISQPRGAEERRGGSSQKP